MFYIVLLDFPFLFPFYIYYIIFFAVCQVVILHKLFCWFLWNFTKTCPIKFFSFPSTLHIYYTLFFKILQGANCTNFSPFKKNFLLLLWKCTISGQKCWKFLCILRIDFLRGMWYNGKFGLARASTHQWKHFHFYLLKY